MLTKCANPKCNAKFRYLHEGKLFIVDRAAVRWQHSSTEPQAGDYYDYYWLCGTCSRSMVVVSDKWVQPQVLPVDHRFEQQQEFS